MSEQQLAETIDFRRVVSLINNELKSKWIYDVEYLLINNSIDDVINVLEDNSLNYVLIKDDQYSNGASFEELLRNYFQHVKNIYDSILISDGKNDRIADRYYEKIKEPVKRGDIYVQQPKENIGMIMSDVEKTLMLMREAINAYYKVYHNKALLAVLSTADPETNKYLNFEIKEQQLLHLLGVTADQLKSNPDFIRLTGRTNMNSVEILEWIMRDSEGNQDLLQYSEDFLNRIYGSDFALIREQYDRDTHNRLLNYHKVGVKSQAFLKYGPLEGVSLVTKLKDGKKLAENAKSNMAMISRAECFKKYPWAYFGSVQNEKDKYIETLLIDSAEGKKDVLKGSTPAIIKGVYIIGSGSDGEEGGGETIFSEEEQFDLFCAAYNDFQDTMDFSDLIEYFRNLSDSLSNNIGGMKK